MTIATTESTITEHEAAQVAPANATKATPVVFVHGLWLLPSSWERWVPLFEEAGYVGVIVKMAGRGHSLTIDAGWREVAERAPEFVKRFA